MDELNFVRKDIDHDLCNYRVDQKNLVDKAINLTAGCNNLAALTYIAMSLIHEGIDCELELIFTVPSGIDVNIILPINEIEPKDQLGYYVSWNNGADITHNIPYHTYPCEIHTKEYRVKIFGLGIQSFGFKNETPVHVYKDYCKYLTGVKSFGKFGHTFTSLEYAFRRCEHNIALPSYLPSNITSLKCMFAACWKFNQPLDNWNVSNVSDMSGMFNACHTFNQPLNNWNVLNVTNMQKMFCFCNDFDQPLNNWNVSNVINMKEMFMGTKFNQFISNWNVSNVSDMSGMFYGSPMENADKHIFNL